MATTYRTHYEERAWIEAHREEFLDQWVALEAESSARVLGAMIERTVTLKKNAGSK